MARRAMGSVDTIWLNMDRPDNLMVIDSVMFLEGRADWERLTEVVRTRLLDVYPVFTERPVQPAAYVGPPHWEDDPDFDLERHLVRHRLRHGDDDAALQRYIERWMPIPLNRDHPLWQIHLIDGYMGGSVVYTRFHHALADGIALTRVLLSLTDPTPEVEAAPAPHHTHRAQTSRGLLGAAAHTVGVAGSTVGSVVGAATGAATGAAAGAAHLVTGIGHVWDPHLVTDAFTQAQRTGAIADKLLLGPHPEAGFNGPPGLTKRAVWSGLYPLADVKHIGRLSGATVNDVLLASVAGALGRYMADNGIEPHDVATMVPVNVRPPDKPLPRELGNQFALVLFSFPVGVDGALARIAETKRRMDVIKHSAEVVLTFGLIKAIGRTGPALERYLVSFFADKAIGVTTNVPGPTTPRYLAGNRILSTLGWVPGSGEQTLGVSIFSYDGTVRIGFKVDAGQVPEPARLVSAFDEEITALLRVAHAV